MAFRDFERLRGILRCPRSGRPLVWEGSSARTPSGDPEIRLLDRCVAFCTPDLPPRFDQPEYASTNPYTWDSLRFIRQFESGIVLDLGAGMPDVDFPNVVQLEIRRYPGTDVVIGEGRLPFADDSFDAVISESVLEHVKDPFLHAAEIKRVLKPGGRLVLHAAFMQPLHGAPYHFFNTTHHALELLFSGLEVQKLEVGPHQHPWITLRWLLQSYMNGLQDDQARQEIRRMTVGELEALLLSMHGKRDEVKRIKDPFERSDRLFSFNRDHASQLGALLKLRPETVIELGAGFELVAGKPG